MEQQYNDDTGREFIGGIIEPDGPIEDHILESDEPVANLIEYADDVELSKFAATDLGNTARLMARYGGNLKFCSVLAKDSTGWKCWDDKRWKHDQTGEAERYAKATARKILEEALTIENSDKQKFLVSWAMQSQGNSRIKAMLSLAKTENEVVIEPGQLDTDPFLFNCLNGTLNLKTGKLQAHDKADLISHLANVVYDPEALCPVFDNFISQITCGSLGLAKYLQQRLGYFLSSLIMQQALDIWLGSGANGKSTLVEIILELMGSYGCTAAPDLLIQSKHKEHPCEVADLFGKRFVVASESRKGAKLRVDFVKSVTGDKLQKARYMRENYFEFVRTYKVILVTNSRPIIEEQGHSIWRRARLLPFDFHIEDEDMDEQLPEKLMAEKSGILNWLLKGFLYGQENGITIPSEVQIATERYKSDSNWMERFADECLTIDVDLWCSSKKLTDTHKDWCAENGIEPDLAGMRDYLRENGCEIKKLKGERGWSRVILAAN